MNTINRILVPTDFSENASKAYNHAQQIASRHGATIDFIHVIPTLQYFGESLAQLDLPLNMKKDAYPHAQERASDNIKKLMNDYLLQENRGEAIVNIAPTPSKVIAEHAEQGNYDLIVIAGKRQRGSGLIGGNITEKLIRYSDVPVLYTNKSTSDAGKSISGQMLPIDKDMQVASLPGSSS